MKSNEEENALLKSGDRTGASGLYGIGSILLYKFLRHSVLFIYIITAKIITVKNAILSIIFQCRKNNFADEGSVLYGNMFQRQENFTGEKRKGIINDLHIILFFAEILYNRRMQ